MVPWLSTMMRSYFRRSCSNLRLYASKLLLPSCGESWLACLDKYYILIFEDGGSMDDPTR